MLSCFRFHEFHDFKKNITEKRGRHMGDILSVILVAIMVVLGGVPSLYILISMPMILAGKIYRKKKFGNSLYD